MGTERLSTRAKRSDAIRRARNRDRISNIYSATVAETPSFDDVELWTLIEGARVGGKPRNEETNVVRAKREYDAALSALSQGLSPLIAGVPVKAVESAVDSFLEACDAATRVARRGAPVHSVINALNFTLVAFGEVPVHVHRAATNALKESVKLAANGSSDALQQTLRNLRK